MMTAMDSTVMVEALRAAYSEVDAALAKVQMRFDRLEQERAELLREKEGLGLALTRHRATIPTLPPVLAQADDPHSAVTPEEAEWVTATRTGAVLRALREQQGAVAPKELGAFLHNVGRRGDTPALISSSLHKLKLQHLATSVGHGKWVAIDPSDVEGSTAATVEPSIPTPTTPEEGGANGTDAPRVLDDHSSWPANHRDHGFGAPVEGA